MIYGQRTVICHSGGNSLEKAMKAILKKDLHSNSVEISAQSSRITALKGNAISGF